MSPLSLWERDGDEGNTVRYYCPHPNPLPKGEGQHSISEVTGGN